MLLFNRTSKRFLRHLVISNVEKHEDDLCRCDSADLNGSGPQEKPPVIYETLLRPTRRMRDSLCGLSELTFNRRARTAARLKNIICACKQTRIQTHVRSEKADSLYVFKVHSTVTVTNEDDSQHKHVSDQGSLA